MSQSQITSQDKEEAQKLLCQSQGLADMADEWVAMGSNSISIDDVRHRAARLREKAAKLQSGGKIVTLDYKT